MPLTIVENGVQVAKTPSRYEIVLDFNTYLAVRTKELNELAAEEVYTQRAKASWKFDGTGDVTDFNGTGDLNDMHWSSTGTKNSGHQLFAEVTSGDVVPVTTGMLTNVAANPPNIVWATKNK